MILLLSSLAMAQPFTLYDDMILYNAGNPSVTFDGTDYHLYYEREVFIAVCPEAWAIKSAVSSDGLSWTPEVGQFTGNLSTCGARSPSVVLLDNGTFAMAYETIDTNGNTEIALLDNTTGVVRNRLTGLTGYREPALVRHDGTWTLMFNTNSDVLSIHSTDLINYSYPAVEFNISSIPWATAFQSVAPGCFDDSFWLYDIYLAGATTTGTDWVRLTKNTNNSWYTSQLLGAHPAALKWQDPDYISDGTNTYVYYGWVDLGGQPYIGVYTDGTITGPVIDRDCHP